MTKKVLFFFAAVFLSVSLVFSTEAESTRKGFEDLLNFIDRLLLEKPDRKLRYGKIVDEAGRRYDLDPAILHAIITIESRYDRLAVSRAGAEGLMQLMPQTQRSLNITDPWDPKQNINGGAKYFRQLLDQFRTYRRALYAYNCGPSNVIKGKIPAESRRYAEQVLRRWRLLRSRPADQ